MAQSVTVALKPCRKERVVNERVDSRDHADQLEQPDCGRVGCRIGSTEHRGGEHQRQNHDVIVVPLVDDPGQLDDHQKGDDLREQDEIGSHLCERERPR
jgi:hypothetical protein